MGRKKHGSRENDSDVEESAVVGGGAGKGKSKKKDYVIDDDEYSIGTEVSEESAVEKPVNNKKKGKKGNRKKIEQDDDSEEETKVEQGDNNDDVLETIQFAGKKKSKTKKGGKSNAVSSSNFGLLEEEEDANDANLNIQDSDGEVEAEVAFTGKKKPSKSKKVPGAGSVFSLSAFDAIGDEEDDNGIVDSEDEPVVAFAGKKKPSKTKKGHSAGSGFSSTEFDTIGDEEDVSGTVDDGEDEPVVAFTGKKKPSKSKKGGTNVIAAASLHGLDEGEDVVKDEEESQKDEDEDEDAPAISFAGKKKSSKGSKNSSGVSFTAALLDEENDEDGSVSNLTDNVVVDDDKDDSVITFSGKKKSSKKKIDSGISAMGVGLGDESLDVVQQPSASVDRKEAEDARNKKKKKKGGRAGQEEDLDKILAELGEGPPASDAVPTSSVALSLVDDKIQKQPESQGASVEQQAETSKNKKKKKKGGKAGQEDEDFDKILAEFGEGASVSKPVSTSAAASANSLPEEEVRRPPEHEEASVEKEADDGGPAESAAAKKRRKKKEKEKEKKASVPVAEETQEETKKSNVTDKKIPKHVREMQERLAKLKEEEERKKREEEERLRKEEEERRRQEELERLAEEKKRLKKEREKEKLLKKKQEGKLLTGKAKEEAKRLEAMRKQFLANSAAGGLPLPTADGVGASTKRPLYQKKKQKPQAQANGATPAEAVSSEVKENQQETAPEVVSTEAEKVEEVEPLSSKTVVSDVKENGKEEEEEEDDDDEEWDAKSWDDADLKLPGKSAFSDEEVDSDPEPAVRKEKKITVPASHVNGLSAAPAKSTSSTEKVEPAVPSKSQNLEAKSKASEGEVAEKKIKAEMAEKKGKKEASSRKEGPGKKEAAKSDTPGQGAQNLRSPICCIMGHVDTGKTKLLDCIRGTNVQEGEAGGITQQIGATYFPAENIRERTKELKADAKLNVPGLLVIDTPGHESFTNLRSRGSGLCDIAILVVDIMHGLEPQTIESLNLLKMRNTEFIVALNKVDRLYGWKTCRNAPIVKAMKQQTKDVQFEFNTRLTHVITQFKEQGLNTELYYKNKEMGETFSIVPTSAISGEGIPDLLLLLVQWTQKTMIERLTYSNEVQCTVLEVKVVEGHGTTIDVVLVNGVLHEGDQIVVCGLQGPIVTTIRALLTPHPMKELRVKGAYLHHKEIKAAQGIKITAQGLEHAIAGTSLYIVGPDDDVEEIKETAMEDMKSVMSRIDKSGEGVYVQASTLGSLEALLEFLKTPAVNIPVSGVSIGPVHKKDVMKASVMLEKKKEHATILAFDVKVTPEARELADELGVKIFIADIIYHLFDQFKAYIDNLREERKKEAAEEAVFPCVLKIIPNCVFNKKDPIVLGVDVLEGIAKVGTPICIPQRDFIDIGRIASIENNHKPVDYAKKGQKVAIKIVGSNPDEQQKMFGRHFEIEDELVSRISRDSLDALKEYYLSDLTMEDKKLIIKLKRLFKIP